MKINRNILKLIGKTPLVQLNKIWTKKEVKIFAKLEGFNPGGSAKDRVAKYMIEDAEKRGVLTKDKILIEATSGNTGIGLAMIAAIKGYRFTALIPAGVSREKRKLLKAYGAKIVLTDKEGGTNYAIRVAKDLLRANKNYLMLDQFNNEANVLAHYETTGPEIIKNLPVVSHFCRRHGNRRDVDGRWKKIKRVQQRN